MKININSRKPFKKIKKYQRLIVAAILAVMICLILFTKSGLIWHNNALNYIEKTYRHNNMSIRKDMEYVYKGQKYKIVLSTPVDNKKDLHLQCFKEEFSGLFYKPTYASDQGGSTSLYGFTMNFIDGSNEHFTVVYGYNEEFKANNFSVQRTSDMTLIVQEISKQEYFLYSFDNIVYPKIIFMDAQQNDISNRFIGQ